MLFRSSKMGATYPEDMDIYSERTLLRVTNGLADVHAWPSQPSSSKTFPPIVLILATDLSRCS